MEPPTPATRLGTDARLWPSRINASAVAILWLLVHVATATAQPVSVGIEGHYRVGRWTAVRVEGITPDASIETRDGDGVQVDYAVPSPNLRPQRVDADSRGARGDDDAASPWRYVIPGSEAAPLVVHRGKEVLDATRFPTLGSPSRGPAMIPLSMPWIVVLGDPLGVDQIGANELLGRDALIAVSQPSTAAGLPDSVLGYTGVDMMLLGSSSQAILESLTGRQQRAIEEWIIGGGRVFLRLGESAEELLNAAPWLHDLLPIKAVSTIRLDPSAIESFTSTQTPLKSFVGVRLPRKQGRVLVMGRTARRVSIPVAAEYNVGLGRITVMAADLEQAPFVDWPDRLNLITRLTGTILIPESASQAKPIRATAYDDLAGQLRLSLDQFSVKRTFGFSVVSLILMALIAAIGPLDYLLINRLFGRPLLGWISFPVVAIGLSLVLAFQSRPLSATSDGSAENGNLHVNRVEIFDIDTMQGFGRGFAVDYLYSHQAARFDVDVTASQSLSKLSAGKPHTMSAPFGYPGESFGGIQIAIEDGRLPAYSVPLVAGGGTKLVGLPLASRSSKGIATEFRFDPRTYASTIEHRPGSELLQGGLTNPLQVDLLDAMLVYRNWAYMLPTRFPAGGQIASIETLRQKNFRWQLSRQKALESASESEAWDPTRGNDPDRIAEMLMFHDAVGGSRYTSLEHRPLSFLDLSHVLAEDRCILIGRIDEPLTTIQATNSLNGDAVRIVDGQKVLTYARIVLPVGDS